MPCNSTHLMTAGRILRRWDPEPRRAPIPLSEPGTRDAFLHGAIAPDMGFMPGVDRWVSELAHWVRPADLARSLVGAARTPQESAFAWGWVAHLMTDVALHPLVGRACGERLRGDRSVRLNASDDEATHVGLEVGLDILLLTSDEAIPSPPARPFLDFERGVFVQRALEETYGLPWQAESLARAHRRAVRLSALWPRALAMVSAARGFPGPAQGSRVRRLTARIPTSIGHMLAPEGSAAAGLFEPIRPPEWLVEKVWDEADRFPDAFEEVARGGLAKLENRNLESGATPDSPDHHPGEVYAHRRLEALAGRAEAGQARSSE